jgi:hypothetical protein
LRETSFQGVDHNVGQTQLSRPTPSSLCAQIVRVDTTKEPEIYCIHVSWRPPLLRIVRRGCIKRKGPDKGQTRTSCSVPQVHVITTQSDPKVSSLVSNTYTTTSEVSLLLTERYKLFKMRSSMFNPQITTLSCCSTNWLAGLNTVAYLLKAKTVEPEKQQFLGNGCVTRKNGVMLEVVFSCGPCWGYIARTSCDCERVLRRQLEEWKVSARCPPACEDVSPGTQPLSENVTKQRSEDHV